MRNTIIAILTLTFLLSLDSCSPKGSSSLQSIRHSASTSKATPKVREKKKETQAEREARLNAERDAEAKALADARQAQLEREAVEEQKRQSAEQNAIDALRETEKAATDAAAQAKERAQQAEKEKVVMREEKIKMVESQSQETRARFHIIIGSFKVLNNARQLCQDAIKKNFLPSIMENEDGLYRVAIYSTTTEETARKKLVEIRHKFPEYVGLWLLKEKN